VERKKIKKENFFPLFGVEKNIGKKNCEGKSGEKLWEIREIFLSFL